MRVYNNKRVLVTIKTYPTPARKGVEVSCTGGITDEGHWIRLFPIPFRYLGGEQKFHKYQWVQLVVTKASDYRPESYQPNIDSIHIEGKPIPTSNGWQARKDIVLPLLSPSLCHLRRTQDQTRKTLGIIKPKQIDAFVIEEDTAEWTEAQRSRLSQASFFEGNRSKPLEKIPYKFFYRFKCDDPQCPGHRLSITDWEAGALYLRCINQYGKDWEKYFRQKYETQMMSKYDTHFYVGTLAAHPDVWIIVGLFYPPRDD